MSALFIYFYKILSLMSVRSAIGKIHSGSRFFLGTGCAEPQHLPFELVKQGGTTDRLHDVEIVHILTVGSAPPAEQRFARHFRFDEIITKHVAT